MDLLFQALESSGNHATKNLHANKNL